MKQPDVTKFLGDSLRAANEAKEFMAERSVEEFVGSPLVMAAVERKLIIVGEALLRAEKIDRAIAESITNFRRILGFRHRLVHGYEHISARAVYAIVHDDLPILIRELEALLPFGGEGYNLPHGGATGGDRK